MNVKLDKYIVKNGKQHGFDIYEEKESKVKVDGIETGETKLFESWVGFYPSLQCVADKLFWLGLKDSDARTLEEVLTVVSATRQLIKTAGWTNE